MDVPPQPSTTTATATTKDRCRTTMRTGHAYPPDALGPSPSLGELLRTWRERALLTQERLAERAGLNVRTIRRLENDEFRPRTTSMVLLADALELDGDERAVLAAAARHRAVPGRREESAVRAVTAPQQLPADAGAFVGRERELAALEALGGAGDAAVFVVDGMPGVGKTALAVHAAHRLASRFPDGRLFMDLHGHSADMAPVDPAGALARMLRALGVPREQIPGHADDRAALYRSVLADRRVLVVLDDAADERQVRPLLPAGPGCRVIVTGRARLTGLEGARPLSLEVLPAERAVALFRRVSAGDPRVRVAAPGLLAEVVQRCGRLPLAVRIAAARLRARPAWTVEHLLERLDGDRLAELRAGRLDVAAALDLSYARLTGGRRRAYRLLGSRLRGDFGVEDAAALLNAPAPQARRLLDGLLDVHLLEEPAPCRYRFHDLIRLHASSGSRPR